MGRASDRLLRRTAVLTAGFAARARRHRAPVLEPAIVRVPAFALAGLSAALFHVAFSAMLLANVLFLTGTWHYSIVQAGMALTPGPIAAVAVAPFAGRLAQRIGPGLVGGAGALLFGTGSGMFVALVGLEPAYWSRFFPAMLVGGGGVGLALPAFTIAATATLAPQKLATGIGAQTMFRQIGSALGVAAFVAVLGTPTAATAMSAHDDTRWFMIASSAAAALALVLIRPRRPAPRPHQEAPEAANGRQATSSNGEGR
nr:MFS transporter [Planomonospora venezuelensis]